MQHILLERTGAEDVSSAGEASADYAETDKPRPRGTEVASSRDVGGDYTKTDRDLRRRELDDMDRPLPKTGTDY